MQIIYNNKKHEKDILKKTPKAKLKVVSGKGVKNKLIYADNLFTLKTLLSDYAKWREFAENIEAVASESSH